MRPTHLPTPAGMAQQAYRELGDTQQTLQSDWPPEHGPTRQQAQALREARAHIAAAKTTLLDALQPPHER